MAHPLLIGKMGVLSFPFPQSNPEPEAVNAQGDDGQQQPLDPIAKQLQGGPVKIKTVTVHHRVLGLPAIHHAKSPGIADSEGTDGDQDTEDPPADQLQKATIKV